MDAKEVIVGYGEVQSVFVDVRDSAIIPERGKI